MTKVKNLIVFIRGHNDFDHILPILDYLINYKSKEVCVTIYTHLYVDDKCKKHIDYLRLVKPINCLTDGIIK